MDVRILVVEDDEMMLEFLTVGLEMEGFEVVKVNRLSYAYQEIQKAPPSLILADYQLDEGTAFDMLSWLKSHEMAIPLIVLTAHTDISLAVDAVKQGAEHFIPKPIDMGFLISVLRRTLENSRNQQKNLLHRLERARYERDPFLGTSRVIQELKHDAERIVRAGGTILIQGETGTGKGVLARWLHKIGPRAPEAFVDLNCAGLSPELLESEIFGHQKGAFTGAVMNKIGFLEAANHGTLFLDEIGDMDPQVQPKLLKVVEERRFHRLGDVRERTADVQIIAATHRDLKKMSEDGRFRSDLYFRISSLRLRIPPLRERVEDILLITDKLLDQFSWDMKRGPMSITESARQALLRYSWPGNIRELRNVLERAVIRSDDSMIHTTGLEFEVPDLQEPVVRASSAMLTLKEMERQYIQQVLESEGGRASKAAKRLGMPRSTLYAKIQEYGL